MKLQTKEQIKELKVGEQIWICDCVSIPKVYTYLGIHSLRPTYPDYAIFAGFDGLFKVNMNEENYVPDDMKDGHVFTTKEECNRHLRELLVNQIEYYNSHQPKECPIVLGHYL